MTNGSFPARLHVLLASRASSAVVLRRGPSNAVCSVLWNRANDRFRLGQWLRGRIYERRSDISPDGRHMIYFARGGKRAVETRGSWTAISRVPYLHAVTLFGKGDCWCGGGLFTSDSTYWLNDGCGHFLVRDSREVSRDLRFKPRGRYGGECPGVYYVKLQRDGWTLRDTLSAGYFDALAVFEKPVPPGWILRKYAHAETGAPAGKGCYWDEHELEHPASGIRIPLPDWEWADWDRARLVWARNGCLHAGTLSGGGLQDERTLFDFNSMKFEALAAPY